jgi:hypothetical protein
MYEQPLAASVFAALTCGIGVIAYFGATPDELEHHRQYLMTAGAIMSASKPIQPRNVRRI